MQGAVRQNPCLHHEASAWTTSFSGKPRSPPVAIPSKSPTATATPTALVQGLRSSNPANPALDIDRPIEAQGPVYTDAWGKGDGRDKRRRPRGVFR